MSRDPNALEPWEQEAVDALKNAQGEALLQGIHNIAKEWATRGDGDQQGQWLITLLRVANGQGRFDYELLAFGELRRLYDSNTKFDHFKPNILWYYKWLAEHIPEYADVTAGQIETFFMEMEAFFRASGERLRPVYSNRCRAALRMGHKELAEVWFDKWSAEGSGDSDDCPACIADFRISYHFERDEEADGLAVAEDLLNGSLSCDETPITFSHLLLPIMKDRPELAWGLQRYATRYVRKVPKAYYAIAPHLVFLAIQGDFQTGRRLAMIALSRALESNNDAWRFSTYRGAGFFFSAYAILNGPALRLPRTLFSPVRGKAEAVPLPEIAARCFAEARSLATKFDRRNGTPRYSINLGNTEDSIRRLVEVLSKGGRRG